MTNKRTGMKRPEWARDPAHALTRAEWQQRQATRNRPLTDEPMQRRADPLTGRTTKKGNGL